MRIVSEVCNGLIETEWHTKTIGARSGVLFKAQIDNVQGDYFVNFLLSTDDLERGAEVLREMIERGERIGELLAGPAPCPELYHFRNLRPPSHRVN